MNTEDTRADRAVPDVPGRARPAFLVVTALYWVSLYLYVPVLAPYAEFRGGTLEVVGLVVSAYGFAQLLLRVPVGIWSDRLGKRRPFLALGFVASAISCVGFVLAPNAWAMVGARFITGIAACSWVVFTVLFASYFPPGQTARAMSYITLCNSLSVMSATAVGGRLADLYGWLAPFWASLVVSVLGLVCTALVYERPGRRPASQPSLERVRSVMRYPELVFASVVAALGQYTTFATVFGFVPNYAVSIGASKTELGVMTMAGTLASALAILFSGRVFAPKLGARTTVVGGHLVAAAATAVIPYLTTVEDLYISQVVAGFARGAAYPILMGLAIARLPDPEKATAMGFFQAVYAIGMFAGPVAAGAVGGHWGYTGLFLTTAGVSVVASGVAVCLPGRGWEKGS